jgi:predicted short-subunit dehydrogenase-like oxidoreductase (DUF2520 family)
MFCTLSELSKVGVLNGASRRVATSFLLDILFLPPTTASSTPDVPEWAGVWSSRTVYNRLSSAKVFRRDRIVMPGRRQ